MVFGLVKKVFKGVKKAVSSTWKRIKKAFKSVGKFMGKIGIIGQIGLALLLPGVGQILSNMLIGAVPGVTGGLAGALQGMGAVGKAAAGFIKGAVNVASKTSKFFGSITDGVKSVVGDALGAAAQNLGITAESAIGKGLSKVGVNMGVEGWGEVLTNASSSLEKVGGSFTDIFSGTGPSVSSNVVSQTGQQMTESVSADLTGKIDQKMQLDTTLNPTADVVVTAPDLSKAVSPTNQALTDLQAGAYTTDKAGNIIAKTAQEPSLLEKTSQVLTGQSVDENITAIKAEAASAVRDFIPETGKSMAKEALYQAAGLSPKPEDFRSVAYGGSVNLPSMEGTAIGTDFMTSPYQSVIQSVSPQFAMANPYGIMAQQYNFNQYAAQLQRTA
jgi:hypothetical protein|tara:strand:+ start:143 stop:1300 length:1158 start_codon:yes stop_codon:yes gene_type:complete